MSESVGILAACGTLLCWTLGTFAFTRASKLYPPKSVNRVRLLYACVLLSIITCAWSGMHPALLFTQPLAEHWLWLGISGIIGLSIGDYFAFTAYKIMGSSRSSLFTTFAPGAALLGGYLLLGEQLNTIGLFGMAISVSGIVWFVQITGSKKKEALDKQQLAKGVTYATLGALCQGLGLAFAKRGLILDSEFGRIIPLHATWIRMFAATLSIYLVGVFKGGLWQEFKAVSFTTSIIKPVAFGTLFGPVLGVSLSLYAASVIEVGLAQTIFSLLPISVMLVAVLLRREKAELYSFVAALIGVTGVIVLVWRNEIVMLFR
jgi:drug/metabolite transporter (DMT)-like permease